MSSGTSPTRYSRGGTKRSGRSKRSRQQICIRGPPLDNLGQTAGAGGLQNRILRFGRLGGGLTKRQREALVRKAFSIEPGSPLGKYLVSADDSLMEGIDEHLRKIESAIDAGEDFLIEQLVGEELHAVFDEQLERLEEKLTNVREDVVELGLKALPEAPEDGRTCQ